MQMKFIPAPATKYIRIRVGDEWYQKSTQIYVKILNVGSSKDTFRILTIDPLYGRYNIDEVSYARLFDFLSLDNFVRVTSTLLLNEVNAE